MRRSLRTVLLFSLLAAPATPALAQIKVIRETDKTVYQRIMVISFGDTGVTGETAKPEGIYDLMPQKAHFASHIRLRVNFADELRRSSDNL